MRKGDETRFAPWGIARTLLALLGLVVASPSGIAVRAQQDGSADTNRNRQAAQRSKAQKGVVDSEKQRAAEEAADRIMRRFYETLDFGTIYKELFVADPAREFEVSLVVDNKINRDGRKRFSFAAKERAYVAMINFWWLASAARFTAADPESLKASMQELREPYEGMTRSDPEKNIRSDADLDERFTAAFNRMSDLLRKQVSPAVFGTAKYRQEVETVEESQADEREELKELFADVLKPGTELYVARRDMHYLYLIEQNGEFRMLTYTSRRRH